jgi:tetratricopeptide (TPR) repeat protein
MTFKSTDFFLCHCSVHRRLVSASAACALLFVILLAIYGNSFNASWHFDDFANIVDNPKVHIHDLTWSSLIQTGEGILDSARLSRPVSYISFGLNYYFGGLEVFGYHVVNFTIHFLTAFILYLFVRQMVQLPLLSGRYVSYAHSIALLSALLWAINPLQVFAVTNIVQRMASLAALFYLTAMYLYLNARIAASPYRKIFYYGLCLIVALLSVGTKENAAMLPVSILFMDLFLIRGIDRKSATVSAGILFALLLLLLGYGLLLFGDIKGLIGDFSVRGFTAMERLMTQPRVFFYYITLLFYPISSRLMLIDDLEVSRSLFQPLDTIFAIFGLGVIVALIIAYSRRRPLMCFCVLFFLLNHLIEGSFSSLEMIHLHRNYLPSMLLFVPVALGGLNLLDWQSKKKSMLIILCGAMVFFLILQSMTVYIQNDIFRDELSLWSDNAKKMPHLHRTRQNHGLALMNAGRMEEGLTELDAALNGKMSGSTRHLCLTYSAMGQYYFHTKQYDKSWPKFSKALEICPPAALDIHMKKAMSFVFFIMAQMALDQDRGADAELMAQEAIRLKSGTVDYEILLGETFLKQKKAEDAIKQAQLILQMSPHRLEPLSMLSRAFKLQENTRMADHYRGAFENLRKGS